MNTLSNSTFVRALGGSTGLLRIGFLVGILLLFSSLSPDFANARNTYALLQSFALLGLVTAGLALTMLAGEFDLSVGAMVAVGGLITLKVGGSDQLLLGVAAASAFAVLIGLINAALFAWLRISSLVITVGSMITLSGFAYWLAGGRVISTDNFDAGALLDDPVLQLFSVRSLLTFFAFLAIAVFLRFTVLGRDIIATGSRAAAANASGVSTSRAYALVFVLSSLFAALAGAMLSISLATASPTMGGNLLLQAASAAIIGGVALSGGIGGAGGILVGVLILTSLNNGLSFLGASAATTLIANGAVLLLVVLFDGRLGAWLKKHVQRTT